VVAGWQTLTWIAAGLDLTTSQTRITLLPDPGTIDTAPGQSRCFDDMALADDGTAPPSSDDRALGADSINRCSRFRPATQLPGTIVDRGFVSQRSLKHCTTSHFWRHL